MHGIEYVEAFSATAQWFKQNQQDDHISGETQCTEHENDKVRFSLNSNYTSPTNFNDSNFNLNVENESD